MAKRKSPWAGPPRADATETPYHVHEEQAESPEESDEVVKACPIPDIEGVKRIALQHAKGPLGFLLWMDTKFVAQGQHALSDWWKQSFREFFDSEKTWGIWQVGRGGGKSTGLERLSILYVLFGSLLAERHIPPGQRWIWPFISASTQDAGRRIREIQALNMALGLETKPKQQHGQPTMEFDDVGGNAVAFVSIAATIAGVSGPSALGITIDEEAKLRDRSANVNPSTEILASAGQMFRARPGVKGIRCSSAWREGGSHWLSIQEGDTPMTYVARIGATHLDTVVKGLHEVALWEEQAKHDDRAAQEIRDYALTVRGDSPNIPTWLANPTISAIASRMQAENIPVDPNEGAMPKWRVWLRECASVAMPAVGEGAVANLDGLTEANATMNARGRALQAAQSTNKDVWAGSKRWPNLPSWDPRSDRYRGPEGTGGRGLL
jgi:hypothetical protein